MCSVCCSQVRLDEQHILNWYFTNLRWFVKLSAYSVCKSCRKRLGGLYLVYIVRGSSLNLVLSDENHPVQEGLHRAVDSKTNLCICSFCTGVFSLCWQLGFLREPVGGSAAAWQAGSALSHSFWIHFLTQSSFLGPSASVKPLLFLSAYVNGWGFSFFFFQFWQ